MTSTAQTAAHDCSQQQLDHQPQQHAPSNMNTPCWPINRKRKKQDEVGLDTDVVYNNGWQGRRQAKRRSHTTGQERTTSCQQKSLSPDQALADSQDDSRDISRHTKTGRDSKGEPWSEHSLRRLIARATRSSLFPRASDIHPTAVVVANSVVVPSVPIHIFYTLQSILPSIPATTTWKTEFVAYRSSNRIDSVVGTRRARGCLTITMPTRLHEDFIPFTQNIAEQLFNSHFLPPEYGREEILQSGSAEIKANSATLVPDASLSLFDSRNTFLVLEVAYAQRERDAQRKAQTYLLNTGGQIKFVILVVITKNPRKKTAESQQSAPYRPEEIHLSPDHDAVHVHVYKSVVRLPHTLTGEHVIDKIQIFPGPGPAPDDTFTISWSDVNCGTWSDFCHGARLPADTPQPECNINFSALVSIAQNLAGQASSDRLKDTLPYKPRVFSRAETPLDTEIFLDSSSPDARLPSGGTVLSDEERRLDPDYQPSVGSSDSFSSS